MGNTLRTRSFKASVEDWASWGLVAAGEGLSLSAWIRRTLGNEAAMVLADRARVEAEVLERERVKSVMEGAQ